jgi:hypothetical protein
MLKSNKIKVAVILVMVMSLCACIESGSNKDYFTIPKNTVNIYEHVTEAWINYNRWDYELGCTYTYIWLDVRNTGRNDLFDLQLKFKDMPTGLDWNVNEVSNMNKLKNLVDTVEYDPTTRTIKCLKAQHNLETDEWNPEYECTILLRIQIKCGQKGGWDFDADGIPDTHNPVEGTNRNGTEVGTFPGDYYVNFYIDHPQVKQTTTSLIVHVENVHPDDMKDPNPDYPYYPV